MKLCLSGLPALRNAVYLTSRLRPNVRPSLTIPLSWSYLLPRALHYDGVITQSEIKYFIDALHVVCEWGKPTLDLEILETVDYRHESVIRLLRGFFERQVKILTDNVIIPITPGLENTTLLSLLPYATCRSQRSRVNYVVDIRDFTFKREFLKEVFSILRTSGDLYVVSDNIHGDYDEIYVSERAHIAALSRLTANISRVNSNSVLVKEGNIYVVKKSNLAWLRQDNVMHVNMWREPPKVNYLKMVIGDKVPLHDVIGVLLDLLEYGGMPEREFLQRLMDCTGEIARPLLFLLAKYGFLNVIVGPMGRVCTISDRGYRLVLEWLREREA